MTADLDIKAGEFVLGTLTQDERRALAEAARQDPALAAAIEAWEERLAPLAARGPDEAPPSGLLARIEEAIDRAERDLASAIDLRLPDGEWKAMAPGIEAKTLWDDKTLLLRAAPGARFPAHDHREIEHCVVVSGYFVVSGVTYEVGDYHGMPPGHRHDELVAPEGALVLIRYGN